MFTPSRFIYFVAMYTGCRAMFNRWRCLGRPRLRVAKLDRAVLMLARREPAVMRVHSRPISLTKRVVGETGMIAVYLKSPGISSLAYRLLRLTSHFGDGHIELAFVEDSTGVTFYAIRNILRSNLERFGGQVYFRGLKLGRERDEWLVLLSVIEALESCGIRVAFAPPAECVALAVNKSLVSSETQARAAVALERKYKKVMKVMRRSQESRQKTAEVRSVFHSDFSMSRLRPSRLQSRSFIIRDNI
jgi:hypothetical protein